MVNHRTFYWILVWAFLMVVVRNVYSKDETLNEDSTDAIDTETEDLPTYDEDEPTTNDDMDKEEEKKLNEEDDDDHGSSVQHQQTTTENSTLSNTPQYAKLGQFPWIVVYKTSGLSRYNSVDILCTGSLINAMWVLTVAHCFQPNDDPQIYNVYAGIIKVPAEEMAVQREIPLNYYQERKISEIIAHPSFNYEQVRGLEALDSVNGLIELDMKIYLFNIALMHLDMAFIDSSETFIRPLALSSSVVPVEALCTIVSWERFQDESQLGGKTHPEMRLQWKEISVEPSKVCEKQYKVDIPNIICVDSNAINKTCYGPGGSPLVCAAELVGISLWYKTPVGCNKIMPQYLWLKSHTQWIKEVMLNGPVTPKASVKRYVAAGSRLCADGALVLAVIVCVLSRSYWTEVLGLGRCF